jgi:hypothetical protein
MFQPAPGQEVLHFMIYLWSIIQGIMPPSGIDAWMNPNQSWTHLSRR